MNAIILSAIWGVVLMYTGVVTRKKSTPGIVAIVGILLLIAANWLEGFLRGSGTLLLIDEDLWTVVNSWVDQLEESVFTQLLPLLRRTFACFTSPERRKLGEKLKSGGVKQASIHRPFDETKMEKALPVVMQLLGY